MSWCKFHHLIDNYTDYCEDCDMKFDIDDSPLWETCENCTRWKCSED